MKCPVIFRASFQQPTDTAMKLPDPVEVEIYHTKIGPPAEWRARSPITRVDFNGITPQSTPATLRKQIAYVHFEKQLTAWDAFDGRQEPPRKLLPTDWRMDKDGHVFLSEWYLEKLKCEETARKNGETGWHG